MLWLHDSALGSRLSVCLGFVSHHRRTSYTFVGFVAECVCVWVCACTSRSSPAIHAETSQLVSSRLTLSHLHTHTLTRADRTHMRCNAVQWNYKRRPLRLISETKPFLFSEAIARAHNALSVMATLIFIMIGVYVCVRDSETIYSFLFRCGRGSVDRVQYAAGNFGVCGFDIVIFIYLGMPSIVIWANFILQFNSGIRKGMQLKQNCWFTCVQLWLMHCQK